MHNVLLGNPSVWKFDRLSEPKDKTSNNNSDNGLTDLINCRFIGCFIKHTDLFGDVPKNPFVISLICIQFNAIQPTPDNF